MKSKKPFISPNNCPISKSGAMSMATPRRTKDFIVEA